MLYLGCCISASPINALSASPINVLVWVTEPWERGETQGVLGWFGLSAEGTRSHRAGSPRPPGSAGWEPEAPSAPNPRLPCPGGAPFLVALPLGEEGSRGCLTPRCRLDVPAPSLGFSSYGRLGGMGNSAKGPGRGGQGSTSSPRISRARHKDPLGS